MSSAPETNLQAVKQADVDHAVEDVFRRRWSPRAFAERPVEASKIQRMLEAARWTMSSYNEQPWRYVVGTKSESPETYRRIFDTLAEANQRWADQAPVLMASFYRKTFSKNDRHNRCAAHDVGAASAALTFQATSMDLYVHQMAGFSQEAMREAFDVPDVFEPMATMAVGYLGDPETLSESLQSAETRPRSRKPQSEFVFEGTWGEAADLDGAEAGA